jgi:hypothetical protein
MPRCGCGGRSVHRLGELDKIVAAVDGEQTADAIRAQCWELAGPVRPTIVGVGCQKSATRYELEVCLRGRFAS